MRSTQAGRVPGVARGKRCRIPACCSAALVGIGLCPYTAFWAKHGRLRVITPCTAASYESHAQRLNISLWSASKSERNTVRTWWGLLFDLSERRAAFSRANLAAQRPQCWRQYFRIMSKEKICSQMTPSRRKVWELKKLFTLGLAFGRCQTVRTRAEFESSDRKLAERLVRAVGIEPTLLAERDFESRASTNSTTPALRHVYSDAIIMRNVKSEQCGLLS